MHATAAKRQSPSAITVLGIRPRHVTCRWAFIVCSPIQWRAEAYAPQSAEQRSIEAQLHCMERSIEDGDIALRSAYIIYIMAISTHCCHRCMTIILAIQDFCIPSAGPCSCPLRCLLYSAWQHVPSSWDMLLPLPQHALFLTLVVPLSPRACSLSVPPISATTSLVQQSGTQALRPPHLR
jgi:hypothetical protein